MQDIFHFGAALQKIFVYFFLVGLSRFHFCVLCSLTIFEEDNKTAESSKKNGSSSSMNQKMNKFWNVCL